MTQVLPRPVAGMRFQESHVDGIRSDASEGFWALWRHNADALRALGIRPIKKNPDSKNAYWIVTWAPGKVAAHVVDRKIADLQLELFATQRAPAAIAPVAAVSDRHLMANAGRRKLVSRFGEMPDADLIAAAQAAGHACWEQWGAFCVNKKKLLAFSEVDARVSITQAAWLLDPVDQTNAKAEQLRENLTANDDAVDWPDDDVAAAVESLCWHDLDQATEENGEGWSKADSSKGHWCRGMIKRGGADRNMGIDAARGIVGKYTKQLKRGEAA